jgi:hypothetical protein
MKVVWQSALSVVLGFIGGVLAMNINFHLKRDESEIHAETVRAARFELVDSLNSTLSYWGRDKQGLDIEIAFLDEKNARRAKFGIEANQLKAGHPIGYNPFTELVGSDGRDRFLLHLDGSESPILAMGDSKTEDRLLLGHWRASDVAGSREPDSWGNWSLVFKDPSHGWRDYVEIGVTTPLGTEKRTGYAVLRNSKDQQLSLVPTTPSANCERSFVNDRNPEKR